MTPTERDLRQLLEHDSLDGRHRGVTVADVDRRTRRIRRGRLKAVASVAVAGLAIAAGGTFAPVTPSDDGTWRGVMARPTPAGTGGDVYEPFVSKEYTRAGKREVVEFTTEARNVGILVTCPLDSHVLLWLNGRRVMSSPCSSSGWLKGPLPVISGKNTLAAIVVPSGSVGTNDSTEEGLEELAAWATPYEGAWQLEVANHTPVRQCGDRNVIIDPDTGREVLSWKCGEDGASGADVTPPATPQPS